MSDDWGNSDWPTTAPTTTTSNDDDGWGDSNTTASITDYSNQRNNGLDQSKGTSNDNKRKLDDYFAPQNDRSGFGRGLGRAKRRSEWEQTNRSNETQWNDSNSQQTYQQNNQRSDNSFGSNRYSSDSKRKIQISSSFVGKVIGKGGQNIKELQSKSGARIHIDRDSGNSYETDIELCGTTEQMDCAEKFINDLVGSNSNYNNSQNNYKSENKTESIAPEDEIIDWGAAIKESEEATKLKWASLPPINKQFYFEHSDIRAMNPDLVDSFRMQNNNIIVDHFNKEDSRPIPNPIQNFKQAFEHFRQS